MPAEPKCAALFSREETGDRESAKFSGYDLKVRFRIVRYSVAKLLPALPFKVIKDSEDRIVLGYSSPR